ncbi:MAG TPA: hydantoinase/oxoprolinase family protein [Gaiellaceae bacterium]|nr:hydantoinase/oxoprolinase family protein [Gaiellaceae bacterium]
MSTIGVDTGGTFTDLVEVRDDGTVATAKRPSTPPDFSRGVIDVVGAADGGRILADADYFYHGTTVATNAMITGSGVKIGFVTTAGHRDVLPMMRIIGRSAGRSEIELKQYSRTYKPQPIVPKTRIKEVHERIDYQGRVVVPLNEASARQAVRELVADGVEAIGVCFLWSFKNRTHEQRMREIVLEEAPEMHVSISSDIVPAMREYERSATTAVNAYLAPLLSSYLHRLEGDLQQAGLRSSLFVMQSLGGAMRADDAEQRAVNTLVSGPAGGVIASRYLGSKLGHRNIICADVGGTSFDVALIVDGEPIITSTTDVNQYTLLVPTIDIVSIGAGGGSIAWVDLGRLRVGPQSAGADPGPACYGRGGTEATVTDADVVLGYIDPSYFLGGEIALDRELAERAIRERVAEPLGMSVAEAAAGIVEIANQHMSDLIRKLTIERGYDPRDFVVYAFGGAGPLHGGAFGRELGVREIVYPLGNIASAFSAFGLAVSDLQTVTQISDLALAPFDPQRVNEHFERLEEEAVSQLARGAVAPESVTTQRVFELRYKGQVHQVDTPVPAGRLDAGALEAVIDDFERRYETLYGRGSGFREAGVELVTYRVLASARVQDAEISEHETGEPPPEPTHERLHWRELDDAVETAIYRGSLPPGTAFDGPAVIRLESTTALVHPGQRAAVDSYGNIRVTTGGR